VEQPKKMLLKRDPDSYEVGEGYSDLLIRCMLNYHLKWMSECLGGLIRTVAHL